MENQDISLLLKKWVIMKDKLENLEKLKDSEFEELIKEFIIDDKKHEKHNEKFDENGDELKDIVLENKYKKREKEKKDKERFKFLRYLSIGTGFVFSILSPVILMVVLYVLLENYVFHQRRPIVFTVFVILGFISGYWALYKEIKEI